MRIFDCLTYPLKNIPFQNIPDCVHAWLRECGITYQQTAFFAHTATPKTMALTKKRYPVLDNYHRLLAGGAQLYTSVYPDSTGKWSFHAASAHGEAVWSLVKSIPRPLSYGFAGFMMDSADWNGQQQGEGLYRAGPHSLGLTDYSFSWYYSDSIRLYKNGKYHHVDVMVERFVEDGKLQPLPDAVRALQERLGKPTDCRRRCIVCTEEEIAYRQRAEALRCTAKDRKEDPLFAPFIKEYPRTSQGILAEVTEQLQPLKGVSPKAIFSKEAKMHGYRFDSHRAGVSTFIKQNDYGHRFIVEATAPSFTSCVFMHIWAAGWNFHVAVGSTPQATIHDADTMAAYAKVAFEAVKQTEMRLSDQLLRDFGATSAWYWEP